MLKIGDLWYLKGDMHIHTNYSDGEQLEENLAKLLNCGMDFCAITDHDNYNGSKAAIALLEKAGAPCPVIIRGQEATCSGCHILAYGTLEEFNKTGPLEEVCADIRKHGGYAVAAHPDWSITRKTFRENGLFQSLIENNHLDGAELMNIEVINDPAEIPREWTNCYYQERLRAGSPFPITVGSDAHHLKNITPDRFVAVFAERCDEASILEAIFKKRLSVAVCGEYAYGTPEALELYRHARALETPSEISRKLNFSQTDDGEFITFDPPAEKYYISGPLTPQGAGFFKAGFARDTALLLTDDNGKYAAFSISFDDAVSMKCIPACCGNTVVPQLEFVRNSKWQNTELVLSGSINGRTFRQIFTGDRLLLSELPLRTDGKKNDISLEIHSQNGILLSRKSWDYPIALYNNWIFPENLRVDAPPPGGKEVSVRFRFSKDGENTILEMVADDPHFCQPFSNFCMYMGDCIQFGLDMTCAASENDLVSRKVWELGIALTPNGKELIAYNTPAGHDKAEIEQIAYTIERTGDIQTYRLVLPPAFTGKTFGFNMIYNINDGGGRRGYLGWRNGIADRKRSADWGFVICE